jgi:hypothetical protein
MSVFQQLPVAGQNPTLYANPNDQLAANYSAIAKIATYNPEAAAQIAQQMTGQPADASQAPPEHHSFWDSVKHVVGDVLGAAGSIGAKVVDIISRPMHIIPELITNKTPGGGFFRDTWQALSGQSDATGADVMEKWGIHNSIMKSVLGLGMDIVDDPLTWLTVGAAGVGSATVAETAARTAGTEVLGKELATKSLEELGGRSAAETAGKLLDHFRGVRFMDEDMAGGAATLTTNLVSEEAQKASLSAYDTVYKAAASGHLYNLPAEIPLADGSTLSKSTVEDALNKLRTQGNHLSFFGRTDYEMGKAASGALRGVRLRVAFPFTTFRYVSPSIPWTEKLGFTAFKNFFAGTSAAVRVSSILDDPALAEVGSVALKNGGMATMKDWQTALTDGFQGIKDTNSQLANYLGGSKLGFGSMYYRAADQMGQITSSLSSHAAAWRAGGLAGKIAAQTERATNGLYDHVIENYGYKLYEPESDVLLKGKEELLKGWQKEFSPDPERQKLYSLFKGQVPPKLLDRTGALTANPEQYFAPELERYASLVAKDPTDEVAAHGLARVQKQIADVKRLDAELTPGEKTSLWEQGTIANKLRLEGLKAGMNIADITTDYDGAIKLTFDQTKDWQVGTLKDTRNQVFWYSPGGARYEGLHKSGFGPQDIRGGEDINAAGIHFSSVRQELPLTPPGIRPPGDWVKDSYGDIAEPMPISTLKKYREYDRAAKPMTDLQPLKDDILQNGIKEPLILTYNPTKSSVLLEEGNHRLAAAEQLVSEGHHQFENLPVRVSRVAGEQGGKGVSVPAVEWEDHVNADLRPSEVFRSSPIGKPVPMGVRPLNPLYINKTAGAIGNDQAIYEQWVKDATESVDAARDRILADHPYAIGDTGWEHVRQEKIQEGVTAAAHNAGKDSIIIRNEDGSISGVMLDASEKEKALGNHLGQRVKVIDENANHVIQTHGYDARISTPEFHSAVRGDGDPMIYRTPVRAYQMERKYRDMDILTAEKLIKQDLRERGLNGQTFNLPDELNVFQHDPIKAHVANTERIAQGIREEALGMSNRRLAYLSDLGINPAGGFVQGHQFKWLPFTSDDAAINSLGKEVSERGYEYRKSMEKSWQYQDALMQDHAERFGKTIAQIDDHRDAFSEAQLSHLDLLKSKVQGAIDEHNKVVTAFTTKMHDIQPAFVKAAENRTGFEPLMLRGFEGWSMPAYIAREVNNTGMFYKDVGEMRQLWRRFLLGPWKKWATVMNPGFHGRINIGHFFNNFIGDSQNIIHDYDEVAIPISRAMQLGTNKFNDVARETSLVPQKIIDDLHLAQHFPPDQAVRWRDVGNLWSRAGVNSTNTQTVRDIITANEEAARIGRGVIDHSGIPGQVKRAGEFFPGKPYHWVEEKASHAMDNELTFHRYAAMAAGMRQTEGDIMGARAYVMMRHGDYTDLTDAERFIRDVVPFYKFMRTNIPFQIHQILENPARQLAIMKLSNAALGATGVDPDKIRRDLPEWMRDETMFPLPFVKHKGDQGLQLMTMSLPMSDLYKGANEYVTSALPIIMPILESTVFKKNIFSGAPLEGKLVPLAGWAKLPGIAQVISPFVQHDVKGNPMITDQVQNILSGIPIFARFHDWVTGEPNATKRRTGNIVSWLLGQGTTTIDNQSLNSNELAFYYDHIKPVLDNYKQRGITLPDPAQLSPSLYNYLGFPQPATLNTNPLPEQQQAIFQNAIQ